MFRVLVAHHKPKSVKYSFPRALVVKNPPANAGDAGDKGLIPGWGRPPGGGHGNPLQYSCLENSMDRGAWRATVHRITKSQTRLKQLNDTGWSEGNSENINPDHGSR